MLQEELKHIETTFQLGPVLSKAESHNGYKNEDCLFSGQLGSILYFIGHQMSWDHT